jgi:2-hydroxychromene-2-carboxylate isomerase
VESLLTRASSDAAVKERLADNTDEAFARGAFGLPWMACMDEKGRTEESWGVDRLPMVADFL